MTRRFLFTGLLALCGGAAFGQEPAAPPAFQVADVHVSSHSIRPFISRSLYRDGRYEVRTATMLELVALAYGMDSDWVLGGPSWIETDRFDIVALAPPNSTQEALKSMLRTLLADRFKLVVHMDKKEMPSYALTVGKQPKLKEADGSGDTGCRYQSRVDGTGAQEGGPPRPTFTFTCGNMTMTGFTEYIRKLPGGTLIKNPLTDETGLKGFWNFEFHFILPLAVTTIPSVVSDAMDKQVGLKLEPRKILAPVLMIDSVNEKPTGNPPGVTEKLPVAPTEFEAATIKPSAPSMNERNRPNPFQPGGRIDMRGMPLRQLISIAWDTTPDKVVGGPKYVDEDKYDVIAKAPAGSQPVLGGNGPSTQAPIDINALQLMLRGLLIDRFKLTTHSEERPAEAYTLVAGKVVKLKKAADPSARTGCKEGPGPDGKDPRKDLPMVQRLVTCTNTSMAQLAVALPAAEGNYFRGAGGVVIDATGIDGAFDFTLNFSGYLVAMGARGGANGRAGGAGIAGEAQDPGGAIPLFDALEKQIGIKMEMQKHPMPFLVIDHVEQKPTDN